MTGARAERIRRLIDGRQKAVVVLEDIHDPHNAGAVFRSCDAFGVHDVFLVFEQEAGFPPRATRGSSVSADRWLRFHSDRSTAACLGRLKDAGYHVVSTVAAPDAVPIDHAGFDRERVALVLGNEHRGLSPTAVAMSDVRMAIPLRGIIRSLNLSVTGAVCLHEMTRQRRAAGMERYALDADERRAIADQFDLPAWARR